MYLIPGKKFIPNSSDSGPARTPDGSRTNAATAPARPRDFISTPLFTSSFPNSSPPSTPLDMDACSVFSDLSDKPSIIKQPLNPDLCDLSDTQATTDPTNYLASIVKRAISLCEARRSLQEEILKSLEKRERLYLDAVESAKGSLAMTRREVMDIVTRLTDASGGIIGIIFPWQHGVEKEARSTEKKSPSPTPSPITISPAMPVPACPAPVPPRPVPALTPTPLTLAPCSTTAVGHLISASPPVHKPIFPSPPPVVLAPKPTSATLPPPTLTIKPSIPAKPPAVTLPRPNLPKHQELLQRYEQRMNAAKSIKDKAIKVPSIPWPVLNSQFPLDITGPALNTPAFQANLREFINSYSQWKHLTFKQTSTAMLGDWVLILSKIKTKNKGARQMANKVISDLRTFSK